MRSIAGDRRGARITAPKGTATRPTGDSVREAAYNLIGPVEDAAVLDLFAGSGAMGLEALSRGAAHCDFVEKDAKVLATLQQNLTGLGAGERATVHRSEVVRFLTERGGGAALAPPASDAAPPPEWDLAFADPPYNQGIAEALAARWLAAPFATIFGVEHEVHVTLPSPETGPAPDRRVYGITALTFYRLAN